MQKWYFSLVSGDSGCRFVNIPGNLYAGSSGLYVRIKNKCFNNPVYIQVRHPDPKVLVRPSFTWLVNMYHDSCIDTTYVYGPNNLTPVGEWNTEQATCIDNSHGETCVYSKLTFVILVVTYLCRTMACFHVISISLISDGDYI